MRADDGVPHRDMRRPPPGGPARVSVIAAMLGYRLRPGVPVALPVQPPVGQLLVTVPGVPVPLPPLPPGVPVLDEVQPLEEVGTSTHWPLTSFMV